MRPHVIVHTLQSIDGRLAGDFLARTDGLADEYAAIRRDLDPDCVIYGATMAAQLLPNIHPGRETRVRRPVPPGDFVAQETDFPIAIVDPEGTLSFDDPFGVLGDLEGHLVQLLREDVNPGYLSYLRSVGVSYVLAGRGGFDPVRAVEKLGELFGVYRALLMGGGHTDGSFAAAGCVDELSLVVAPVAEVRSGRSSLFETVRGLHPEPISFQLAEVRQLPSSGVWLHYLR